MAVKYSYGPRLRRHYNIVLANSARYRREPVRSNSGSTYQEDFADYYNSKSWERRETFLSCPHRWIEKKKQRCEHATGVKLKYSLLFLINSSRLSRLAHVKLTSSTAAEVTEVLLARWYYGLKFSMRIP